jgi:DNA repair protein RadA/Sms
VLYASAEESPQQVRRRAERLEAMRPRFLVTAESALPHLLDQVEAVQPDLLVVDSIQSVFDPAVGSAPGTVAQVREGAARLATEAKARSMPVVLVGHVTKEGSLAGPRVLEHLVDAVLSFEGDRHHSLRFLRAVKHRFGSTHELGVFEMTDRGLEAVDDPSGLFLSDRRPGLAGSVVVPTMQGYRPLLVEIQALTTPSGLVTPRRSAQGVDSGRLALLLAVLHQRAGVSVADADVYALAVGGARVGEPAADLGIALAVASARAGVAIDGDLTVCAEVGLAGELRQVGRFDRRLAEAARLGFRRAVVPYGTDGAAGITALPARDLAEVLARLGLDAAPEMSRDRGRPPLPGPGRAAA